jgi:hypothetical protein
MPPGWQLTCFNCMALSANTLLSQKKGQSTYNLVRGSPEAYSIEVLGCWLCVPLQQIL